MEEGSTTDVADSADPAKTYESLFKFKAYSNLANKLYHSDPFTAVAFNTKYIAVGTSEGFLHVMNHAGEELKYFSSHHQEITYLKFANQDHVMSASLDGQLVLHNLGNNTATNYKFKHGGITAFEFMTDFSSSNLDICFITTEGKVIHYQKGWFLTNERLVCHEEPLSFDMQFKYDVLAWLSEKSIKLIHFGKMCGLAVVQSVPYTLDIPQEVFQSVNLRPSLVWPNENRIFIAWNNIIKVYSVNLNKSKDSCEFVLHHQLEFKDFVIPSMISLSAKYNMALVARYDTNTKWLDYEIRIFDEDCRNLGIEPLTRYMNFPLETIKGLRLASPKQGFTFLVYHQHDFVKGESITKFERGTRLLSEKKFDEVFEIMKEATDHTKYEKFLAKLRGAYMQDLFQKQEYEQLAVKVTEMAKTKDAWHHWICKFINRKQIQLLYSAIPIHEDVVWGKSLFRILVYFLENDHRRLFECLRIWPDHFYNFPKFCLEFDKTFYRSSNMSDDFYRCKIQVALKQGELRNALEIMIHRKFGEVFTFIEDSYMNSSVIPFFPALLNISEDMTMDIFMRFPNKLQPTSVINMLAENESRYGIPFMKYLMRLTGVNPTYETRYYTKMCDLFIRFDRSLLYRYIDITHQDLEPLLELVQKYEDKKAEYKLLRRLYRYEEALEILLDDLKDYREALEFVAEVGQEELWKTLIPFLTSRDLLIRELIQKLDTYNNCAEALQYFDNKMLEEHKDEFPILLRKVYEKKQLHELAFKIQHGLAKDLMKQRHKKYRRGFASRPKDRCSICLERLRPEDWKLQRLILFDCGHFYHKTCLVIPHDETEEQEADDSIGGRKRSEFSENSKKPIVCPICKKARDMEYRRNERMFES